MSVTPIPPPTARERAIWNDVSSSTGRLERDLQLLREFNITFDTRYINMDDVKEHVKQLKEDNAFHKDLAAHYLAENKALKADLDLLLSPINESGLQQTLVLWKSWSVEERMHYERISHDCPVGEHPEIFIDTHGYIRLTNGRFA